jgi:hypothetical protein
VLPADNPWVSEAIRLAEKYDLPRDVFLSMVYQESGFNPEARSRKGAYGLTQLMPGTAADLRADRYDPAQNLDAGARYLRQQIDRFGSLPLALAAYNAGPTRVARAGNQIPQILETQNYVKKVLGRAGVEGYAEGGLAELDQKYADGGMVREPATAYDPDEIDRIVQEFAEGGEVEAPAETTINGQEHKLAYITDREAALLKARGGSGRMTKHGIRAYNDANSDNANSNSEAAAQDAAGGNQGQGAGPTGAGAGAGPPGPPDSNPNQSMSSEDPEGTQAAANMQTAVDAREAGRGYGIADTGGVAPTGFNAAPGIAEAIGALGRGEIGFGQALGYGVQSAISPPGVQMGVNVDEIGNQTPAVSVSVPGVIGGLMGLATGIPGASAIGSMIGNEIGKELGLDPTVMSYEPGVFNAPEPTPAYGAAGYGMDYGQGYAHGGLAKLHQKYAEGGEVNRELMGQPFPSDYSRYSYVDQPEVDWAGGKRPLNMKNLFDLGAFRFAHLNGDPNSLSLVSYFNDSAPNSVTPNWPTVSRDRAQEVMASLVENPWPLYTGKYNQILDSARRLGISDEDIFLPHNTSTAEGYAKGGEVSVYDPYAVNQLAKQIEAQYV